MKRSPMPRQRRPLRRVSKRRAALLAQRARVRQDVQVRDDYRCRAAVAVPAVRCAGRLDVLEVRRRAQDGSSWLNEDVCLSICRAHHDWVHAHPADAYRLGLLVRAAVVAQDAAAEGVEAA